MAPDKPYSTDYNRTHISWPYLMLLLKLQEGRESSENFVWIAFVSLSLLLGVRVLHEMAGFVFSIATSVIASIASSVIAWNFFTSSLAIFIV